MPGQLAQSCGAVGRFPCDHLVGQLHEPLDRDRGAHAETAGVDADGLVNSGIRAMSIKQTASSWG